MHQTVKRGVQGSGPLCNKKNPLTAQGRLGQDLRDYTGATGSGKPLQKKEVWREGGACDRLPLRCVKLFIDKRERTCQRSRKVVHFAGKQAGECLGMH